MASGCNWLNSPYRTIPFVPPIKSKHSQKRLNLFLLVLLFEDLISEGRSIVEVQHEMLDLVVASAVVALLT